MTVMGAGVAVRDVLGVADNRGNRCTISVEIFAVKA